MLKNELLINKKARYYLNQKPNQSIEQVWIVCHGYGQLAEYFLKWFNPIFSEKILIIAPEGLHRFYVNGFSGRVGASWMTKEDRLNDIEDYVGYLNNLLFKIKPSLSSSCFIHVLGFSQGVATAIRWICKSELKIDSLSLFAGKIPEDLDYKFYAEKLNRLNPKILFGNKDEFYSPKAINNELEIIKGQGLDFQFIEYEGSHKIEKTIINQLGMLINEEINHKNEH